MAFEWLTNFHRQMDKEANYAEKTLAAYRLGMKANGSIVGVVIDPAPNCCDAVRGMVNKVYHPNDAPYLPLPACPQVRRCHCVYRPVMSYQQAPRTK